MFGKIALFATCSTIFVGTAYVVGLTYAPTPIYKVTSQQRISTFEDLAPTYDRSTKTQEFYLGISRLRRMLLKNYAKGRVLEVACGTATNVGLYPPQNCDEVVLADRAVNMCEVAKQRIKSKLGYDPFVYPELPLDPSIIKVIKGSGDSDCIETGGSGDGSVCPSNGVKNGNINLEDSICYNCDLARLDKHTRARQQRLTEREESDLINRAQKGDKEAKKLLSLHQHHHPPADFNHRLRDLTKENNSSTVNKGSDRDGTNKVVTNETAGVSRQAEQLPAAMPLSSSSFSEKTPSDFDYLKKGSWLVSLNVELTPEGKAILKARRRLIEHVQRLRLFGNTSGGGDKPLIDLKGEASVGFISSNIKNKNPDTGQKASASELVSISRDTNIDPSATDAVVGNNTTTDTVNTTSLASPSSPSASNATSFFPLPNNSTATKLEEARRKRLYSVANYPAERLPSEDNEFDTVVDMFGLCSFHDPVVALREMSRVCNKVEEKYDATSGGGDNGFSGNQGGFLITNSSLGYDNDLGRSKIDKSPLNNRGNMPKTKRPPGRILLLEHGRGNYTTVNWYLDKWAPRHASQWGCWWNRDIRRYIRTAGLEIISAQTKHFGTTQVYVCKPYKRFDLSYERRNGKNTKRLGNKNAQTEAIPEPEAGI